jgi:hypothetical protein
MVLEHAKELLNRFHRTLQPDLAVAASRYFLAAGKTKQAVNALQNAADIKNRSSHGNVALFTELPLKDGGSLNLLEELANPNRETKWFKALENHQLKIQKVLNAISTFPETKKALTQGKKELRERIEMVHTFQPQILTAYAAYPILHRYSQWLLKNPKKLVEHREMELTRIASEELNKLGSNRDWDSNEILSWAKMKPEEISQKAVESLKMYDRLPPLELAAFHPAATEQRTQKLYDTTVASMTKNNIPEADARHLANYLLLGEGNYGFSQWVHAQHLLANQHRHG